MNYAIRLAKADDIPQVDLLFARSYPKLLKPDYAPSLLVTVVPMFSKSQPRLVTSGSFYVAVTADDKIIGAGGWTPKGPRGESEPGLGHIRHFATDPNATRLGVGRALITACVTQAAELGIHRLSCYSTITAVPFYEAMGFEKRGDIEITFGETMQFPCVWLEQNI